MGWKQILDASQIGLRFPGHEHDHDVKNLASIGSAVEGFCSDTDYTTAASCCCAGVEICDEWNPVTEVCSDTLGGDWTPAQPDWTGGLANSTGDRLSLYRTLNDADLTNQLVYLEQDQTNLNLAEWKLTNSADDTAGAKNLLGLCLSHDGVNPVDVLTSGYIALDSTNLFVDTGTALAPGQIVYMAPDNGRLVNVAPSNAPNVVRVIGYITQLRAVGSADLVLHLKPDAVWVEVA